MMVCFAALHSFPTRNRNAWTHDYRARSTIRHALPRGLFRFHDSPRCSLTGGELLRKRPAELNELYSRGTVPSGIADGEYSGTALLFSGIPILAPIIAWLIEALIWGGKRYEGGVFVNKWGPFGKIVAIKTAPVFGAPSWMDGETKCVELGYDETTAPWPYSLVRGEMRSIEPDTYLGIMYVKRLMTGYFLLETKTSTQTVD